MEETAKTAIIGAGISGLCVAHALHESGQPCDILESADQAGGALRSFAQDGYLAEQGPNSIMIKDRRVMQLLESTGLKSTGIGSEVISSLPAAKKRYVVHDGAPRAMPTSPMALLKSPLFSLRGILRAATEPMIGRYRGEGEESFGHFVRRRLGSEILSNAAAPFVSGIYAGNPEELSVRHAFPRLWKLENEHRSLVLGAIALRSEQKKSPNPRMTPEMISFRSGMAALPQAIVAGLPTGTVHLKSQINAIRPLPDGWQISWTDASGHAFNTEYSRLVIATPHHRLGALPLPTEIIEQLKPVRTLDAPPVTSLVLGFKREDVEHPLDGFGMLIKADENSPLLGVLFSSSMFDHRAPEGHVTLTCMMGGSLSPELAENSDEVVLAELHRLLGVRGTPTFRYRSSWENAIPQYGLDYQEAVEALEACENSHTGLYFAGNYRGGISVPDCILNGLQLGKRLGTTEPDA
ncbi:protoporphyrinogen oxidase [Verrucomicrobiaceae bacterium 5K15]|uniref:Coproporphyrinogen III oxidase n=1 Tax=Oceaniferula flava TaxID=2800421 RepID=A0AAE2V7I2_9BACT|nr:protoporphyrinogen oxidase [Oceaniferula flavus]MBK1853827.1 protoporphyrinogen oxidase [Oceaniferula flavus]MBM1135133.1 protoporphyrinogen oxidase [Oceaniferula flavus]